MANKNIFSADFVAATVAAVNSHLHLDDLENCVSAYGLAQETQFKAFKEADGSALHDERLRLMIMSAVSTGQVPGVGIRKGRNGGVFRTKAVRKPSTKKRSTKKDAKAANNTQTTAPAKEAAAPVAKTGTDA